jgi:hypothetical protein
LNDARHFVVTLTHTNTIYLGDPRLGLIQRKDRVPANAFSRSAMLLGLQTSGAKGLLRWVNNPRQLAGTVLLWTMMVWC